MAKVILTQQTDTLDAHSGLGDKPNTNDGLSATQLKTRYDRDVNRNKTFLNGTLIAELQANDGAYAIGYDGTEDNVGDMLNTIISAGTGTIPPDGTITEAKIVDGSVTEAKISDSLAQNIFASFSPSPFYLYDASDKTVSVDENLSGNIGVYNNLTINATKTLTCTNRTSFIYVKETLTLNGDISTINAGMQATDKSATSDNQGGDGAGNVIIFCKSISGTGNIYASGGSGYDATVYTGTSQNNAGSVVSGNLAGLTNGANGDKLFNILFNQYLVALTDASDAGAFGGYDGTSSYTYAVGGHGGDSPYVSGGAGGLASLSDKGSGGGGAGAGGTVIIITIGSISAIGIDVSGGSGGNAGVQSHGNGGGGGAGGLVNIMGVSDSSVKTLTGGVGGTAGTTSGDAGTVGGTGYYEFFELA